MPIRVTNYVQALKLVGVDLVGEVYTTIRLLEDEGRSEKGIAYAIWKEQNKLKFHRHDSIFCKVLIECARKWAWTKNDPRWTEYNKRKEEEEKAIDIQILQNANTKELCKKDGGPGFVYFIQGQCGGPIKIGYAKNVCTRLKELQTGQPDSLVILATFPGYFNDEQKMHKKFEHIRLRGEWFKPEKELLYFIEKYKVKISLKEEISKYMDKYAQPKQEGLAHERMRLYLR